MMAGTSGPRILAIMGSGETAPTMAKVHRALFELLGPDPVPAVIVDTPYGFQENADLLSARTVDFFATSVGRSVEVASYRSRDVDDVTLATAVGRIRRARYVMAGPGSPSYALRQWAGGPIPDALAVTLSAGGVLTMASAAALTLGVVTIPVYEIYKVGEEPRWLEGLDLLGPATGLRAAVVPHYDNAEGGNHDTRFCYVGERRLRVLEDAMPDGAFILGVDSHTALVFDLERRTASVSGLGGVTVRVHGTGTFLPSGSELPIDEVAEVAVRLAGGKSVDIGWEPPRSPGASAASRSSSSRSVGRGEPAPRSLSGPLVTVHGVAVGDLAGHLEGTFLDALGRDEVRAAVAALLEFDSAIGARFRSGEDSPDLDSATSTFRSLIARLGEAAENGDRDPRARIEPLVDALLEVRARARGAGDWVTADFVRGLMANAGIEVRDEGDATTWALSARAPD